MKEITAKGRGKTFWRSVDAARKKIKEGEGYLIRRHGAWFRPKAQGYCCELAGAGVFDAVTARGYMGVEGLSVVPMSSIRKDIEDQIADLEAQSAALRTMASLLPAPGGEEG